MKRLLFFLFFGMLISGCSSTPKQNFGVEYGFYCVPANTAGLKEYPKDQIYKDVPGYENGTCVKVEWDKDPTWDYYVRGYEQNDLPEMPDIP